MLRTDNLEIHHRHEAEADDEFHDLIQEIDELLQKENVNCLDFPVDIDEQCHKATWDYTAKITAGDTDDDDDDEDSYPFNNITFGLYVTTKYGVVKDRRKPYLRAFIGNGECEPIIYLHSYDLGGKLDLVKITNELATAVVTIGDFEVFISNMDPNRREIALNLVSRFLNC
jgi:hypothetical protein